MTTRNTKQKTEIKKYLMSRDDHPSADMVYSALKESMPRISLGTVYRNLNSMADSGEIQRIRIDDNVVRFDARMEEHHHFICRECGGVTDIWGVHDTISIQDEFDGELEGHMTYFFGRCRHCIA